MAQSTYAIKEQLAHKVKQDTIYEQPLNERVRNFLRLEYLYGVMNHHSLQNSQWDNRIAISYLLEVLNFISRSDVKNNLIKELKRYMVILETLKHSSSTDQQKLEKFLHDIDIQLRILQDNDFPSDQKLIKNELIASIKKRISVSGGTCNFDLPAFHHWLNQPIQLRHEDLEKWKKECDVIQNALISVLFMLRNSTVPVTESAEAGIYQQVMEPKLSCQLIRVFLPEHCDYFPEISGGKHRFTIRFMKLSPTSYKSVQTRQTIEFGLHRCAL